VAANVRAAERSLSAEELAAIDEILRADHDE
jgi:hypothetical protein